MNKLIERKEKFYLNSYENNENIIYKIFNVFKIYKFIIFLYFIVICIIIFILFILNKYIQYSFVQWHYFILIYKKNYLYNKWINIYKLNINHYLINDNLNISNFLKNNEELNDILKFIDYNLNGNPFDSNEIIFKSKSPKISIIITVYNGEAFLKTSLFSIQNQDFKDIEIIMIDDCSQDNSVNLIKKLMEKDRRIVLLQNVKNKGMLYTKTKGILNAKGKYVMILDEDDIYAQNNVFSTLYKEAESHNLQIVGFSLMFYKKPLKKLKFMHYYETPILYQPNITNRMYYHISNKKIVRITYLTSTYLLKTDLMVKTIKQIDKQYYNIRMN